jgi:hypothetical protein
MAIFYISMMCRDVWTILELMESWQPVGFSLVSLQNSCG